MNSFSKNTPEESLATDNPGTEIVHGIDRSQEFSPSTLSTGPEPVEDGYVWLKVPQHSIYSAPTSPAPSAQLAHKGPSYSAVSPPAASLERSFPRPLSISSEGVGYQGQYSQPEEDFSTWDLAALWHRIYRYKWQLLSVWCAVLLLAIIWHGLQPKTFKSSASLLVQPKSNSSLNLASDLPILGQMLGNMQGNTSATHVELLSRRQLREKAIHSLPLSQEEKESLSATAQIQVRIKRDTDLLDLTVISRGEKASPLLANALAENYIAANQNRSRAQVSNAAKYVSQQVQKVKQELDGARRELVQFKRQNNTVDPAAEARAGIAGLAKLREEWGAARTQKSALLGRLEKLHQLAQVNPADAMIPTGLTRNPAVDAMKVELTRLELQRLELLQEYTPQSPPVQEVEGKIGQIRAGLKVKAQTEVASWQRSPLAGAVQQQIAETQSQVWETESRGVALRRQIGETEKVLQRVPGQEFTLGQLNTKVEGLGQTFSLLSQRYQQLKLSEQAEVSSVQLIEPAEASDLNSPILTRSLAVGAVLGTVLVLGLGLLMETLDTRVGNDEQVERITGRSVLVRVPLCKAGTSPSLLSDPYGPSPLLESYRMLRVNMDFAAIDAPINAVAITSSQPNEGKSSTSINLGIAMALDGKRVILVDCDLRRPTLHRTFGIMNGAGYTSVVARASSLEEALQQTVIPNLKLLTAGPLPPNPTEILNSQASKEVIARLRSMADCVILDCPPGLVMADAQILASLADATLLVVSAQNANRHEVMQTAQQIQRCGTRMLGVVLNKVEMPKSHARYYREYQTPALEANVDNGAPAGSSGGTN